MFDQLPCFEYLYISSLWIFIKLSVGTLFIVVDYVLTKPVFFLCFILHSLLMGKDQQKSAVQTALWNLIYCLCLSVCLSTPVKIIVSKLVVLFVQFPLQLLSSSGH